MATDERGPAAPALVEKGSRFLLALMVAVFGANKFLGFLEMPPPPEEGGKFLGALYGTGFIMEAVGLVFLAAAALLLMRRVVLALCMLAPIAVVILMYHAVYDMPGIGAGAVLAALMAVVAWCYRRKLASALL
jgi:putative oxidoreductase